MPGTFRKRVRSRTRGPEKRNVLLDGGTHYQEGLDAMIWRFNVDDTWVVHTFEPNVACLNRCDKRPWITYHNVALGDTDGFVTLNIETLPDEGDTGAGTSVIPLDKWAPHDGCIRNNFQRSETVPCIDLGNFIKTHFTPDDNIIVKLDIEGAEYDVIGSLIKNDVLKYINFLAVEWHSRFFTNADEMKEREQELIAKIEEAGIPHERWC